jgi:hypothetical protein
MLDEPDIWRAANLLLKHHGAAAPLVAAQRADEMLVRGGVVGQAIWKRITAAVEELIRRKPKQGAGQLVLGVRIRFVLTAAALIVAGVGCALAGEDEPGTWRWPIKTTVPAAADLEHPRDVPLVSLLGLGVVPGVRANDPRYQAQRIPAEAFDNVLGIKEGDIVRTTGWLHVVARKSDGDYHIQIAVSQDNQVRCLIVEAPNPDPRFKVPADLQPIVAAVRDEIDKHLEGASITGHRRVYKLRTPVHVIVTGQLFYDAAHVKADGSIESRGDEGCHSPTLWELHPVTDISF